MSKFCEKSSFLGEFWLTVLEQDMGTTQILYHSQTKLSAIISRIFRGAMDSSFFREWCTNQPHFFKKSEFKIVRTYIRLNFFSVWAEEVSKIQIFNYYDRIVKDVILVIFIPNRSQATLLKWYTSHDCKGMNSRVFLKRVENRPKLKFWKLL